MGDILYGLRDSTGSQLCTVGTRMVEAVYLSSARVRGKDMLERFCSMNQMRCTVSRENITCILQSSILSSA
jgi:hypothetical protein